MFSLNQAFRHEPSYLVRAIKNLISTLNVYLRQIGRSPVRDHDMLTFCTLRYIARLDPSERRLRRIMMGQLQRSFG